MGSYQVYERDVNTSSPVYGYGTFSRRGRGGSWMWRGLRRGFRSFDAQEWWSMVLTVFTLGVAVYSVQRANWLADLPSLVTVLVFSVLTTAIVLKLKYRREVKIGLAVLLGIAMTVWQSSGLAGQQSLWRALAASPNGSTVHFAVFIILVTWLVGALSIWLVLRRRNAWVPAGLGLAVLLVNLSNLPEEHYVFLPLYLLVALVFVGFVGLLSQRVWLRNNGGRYRGRGLAYAVISVGVISLVGVSVAWYVPASGVETMGINTSGQFVAAVQKNALNIFASVPGKWNIMRADDLETLSFGAAVDKRETVLFEVTASQPAYWRIKRYHTYSALGWTSLPSETGETLKAGVEVPDGNALREEFTYTVEAKSKADVLLVTGEFVSASIAVRLETQGPGSESSPSTDVISVTTPQQLQPYQRYTPTVSVSSATPSLLAEAGTDYPDWVTSRYLQLPSSVTSRVRQLTARVTDNRTSPFSKAVAIEDYLRQLRYNIDARSPSRRGDEVESFLFLQREGVCTDFATAMVVMLRTVGVPARLATGYLMGQQVGDSSTYLVRGRDYHAWPEVYFPDYGWIEFEPTPRPEITDDITIGGGGSGGDTSFEDFFPFDPFFDDGSGFVAPPIVAPAKSGRNIALPIIGIALAALIVVGSLWLIGNRLYQSLRLSGNAAGVYAKMCRLASLVGTGPVPSETPLEYCRRLSGSFPDGATAIGSIGDLYTESRFSQRKDLGDADLVRLQKAWVELYPVLFKRRLPWAR